MALEQVLDLGAEALRDYAQEPDRGPRLIHLDLVEKGAAEVVANHFGQAHAAIVADPADPLAERLAFLDRPGFFLIHVKAQLTGSLAGRGCGSGL